MTQSKKQRQFLAAYAECGNISHAAKLAGIERKSHYRWLEDADYKAEFETAGENAADLLEKEARRRAVEGVRRLKFDKDGDAVRDPETGELYQELQYSDTLLIFLLKGVRPQKFRETIRQEHTGRDGGPIEMSFVDLVRAASADSSR